MKILYLVANDWYFWSHRLSLARAARDAGAEVFVMTRLHSLRERLEQERFRVIDWNISQGSLNPLRELLAFIQVLKVYREVRPDLVHHVAIKPAVYGGGAAQLCGHIPSVNTIAGLGSAFTSGTWKTRLVRPVLKVLLRLALNSPRSRTVFHNDEIRHASIGAGVVRLEQTVVIRGSGVDPEEFLPHPEPEGVPMVLLASRMLWEKGAGEFVSAAKILRSQGMAARFVLVGDSDPANPTSIPRDQLAGWAKSGGVEWWGYRSDMPQVFAQSNVVCLPSYYAEGMPKVLIEAASCARAIVACDVPGCRDVVRHGYNGLLVPARDADALARAISSLLSDSSLRSRFGAQGRDLVLREFSNEVIIRETYKVYEEVLGYPWPNSSAIRQK